ncbi:phosphotransferase [Paenibacillus dendritiformis]|uniref:phosphotransferase n=1 Tax=Paenibacillus dendritiformis TaxID=130049 RepID=UPI00143D0E17|nr:phosphotransferase [Paenibacillus dendritiformis]NKI20658.1 phosphotransferase [Paenibacillus dendritiformis]NRF96543.1 phosphotransferase [Paenibacillus dendritiformis]
MGASLDVSVNDAFRTTVERVCRHFSLGELLGEAIRLRGSFNINVKIRTTTGSYVIRFVNSSVRDEHLQYVLRLLDSLAEEELPVLRPLQDEEGASIMYDEGQRIQVTPYVRGRSFQCREKQVRASAGMLRKFHRLLRDRQPGPIPDWSFYRPTAYLTDTFRHLRSLSGIPVEEISRTSYFMERTFKEYDEAEPFLPRSIIHGDWHFWNQRYLFNDVNCVMDFDFVQHGVQLFDVAYALWVIYLLLPQYADAFDAAFLSGYGELTDEEIRALPAALCRVSLFFLCQAAYAPDPAAKWKRQFDRQMPFLEWMQGEGCRRVTGLARSVRGQGLV